MRIPFSKTKHQDLKFSYPLGQGLGVSAAVLNQREMEDCVFTYPVHEPLFVPHVGLG